MILTQILFIKFINKKFLNESYLKDYKSPSELIIKIKNEKVNIILNNNNIGIDDYIIQLEEKLNKILRDTINAYDNNFILTFLYGKLFINFFNYILDEKGNDKTNYFLFNRRY